MPKPRARAQEKSLVDLLDRSGRPIYAIDANRRIVYCNVSLAGWLGLEVEQIVGRFVEYHSAPTADDGAAHVETGLITGLCPPPKAFAGELASGTVSCVALDGRLVHRQADFTPLGAEIKLRLSRVRDSAAGPIAGVLVLVADEDMSPTELARELSREPSADELHRTIRRFRRTQAAGYAIETLLGESASMRKVRAQVLAAADSGANVLISGQRGSGRSHTARAIHYHGGGGATAKLLPIDCDLLTEDRWQRLLEIFGRPESDAKHRSTLILENLEALPPSQQAQLYDAVRSGRISARLIAICTQSRNHPEGETATESPDLLPMIDQRLLDELSTITIVLPQLVERLDDLPILAQYFLEDCNRDSDKQIGSIQPQALDLLALHRWPGGLDELREAIASAHSAASTHEINPSDLPPVIHHALRAASLPVRQPPERIVLDELLASIEKEAIVRALAQANGNKTEAAALLGMTRPRLYRRLVQLGLVTEAAAEEIVFELDSSEP